jgi:hypothetical protein
VSELCLGGGGEGELVVGEAFDGRLPEMREHPTAVDASVR